MNDDKETWGIERLNKTDLGHERITVCTPHTTHVCM